MSLKARLLMNALAGSLLLAALAYDWLGNLAHELIGTAMLALLIAHNIFNPAGTARRSTKVVVISVAGSISPPLSRSRSRC